MIASANAFLPSSSSLSSPYPLSEEEALAHDTRAALNQTVTQVANTVATASGWMTSTLTSGLGSLNRFIVGDSSSVLSSAPPPQSLSKTLSGSSGEEDDDDEEESHDSHRLRLGSDEEEEAHEEREGKLAQYGEEEEEDGEDEEELGDEELMIGTRFQPGLDTRLI
jgi:hypothetical protein